MNKFFNLAKKIFVICILAGASQAFADRPNIKDSNLKIYTGNQVISGEIQNPSPSSNYSNINISGTNFSTGVNEIIGNFEWKVGPFVVQTTPSQSNFGAYESIRFTYFEDGDSGAVDSESFNLPSGLIYTYIQDGNSPVIPSETSEDGPLANVVINSVKVDFPGWQFIPDDRAILPIPNNSGKYYPVLKSNQTVNGDIITTRSPGSAPLVLVIRNTDTSLPDAQRYGALKLFPGGSDSFNVNFPDCVDDRCQLSPASELEPGQNYEVFLSDDYVEGGSGTPVDFGDSVSSLKSLPTIPQASTDSNNQIVSNIVAVPKIQDGKRYYEITGSIAAVDPAPAPGTFLNFVIRQPGASSGEILGQVPYTPGTFGPIPSNQELVNFSSLAIGKYELAINSTISNGQDIQGPKVLPPMTEIPTENRPTNTNNTQIFTQKQKDILGGGIVPNCGYELGKGGTVCGFEDLITLIQQVIEYIFILTVPIVAIVFAYAGYLYLTSGGNPKKREDAKNAMINVVIGIIVVMSAWLIVTLIVKTLGASSATTRFLDL